MEPDRVADKLWRDDVAFEELTHCEDAGDERDLEPVAPELEEGQPDGERAADQRADIGDEGNEPRDGPDDQAEVESRKHQRDRVERAEDEADRHLPPHETCKHPVDVARDRADGLGMVTRQERIDPAHHLVPVQQKVERHHRHDDDEHDRVDHRQRRRQQPARKFPAPGLDGLADRGEGLAQDAFLIHDRGEVRAQEAL